MSVFTGNNGGRASCVYWEKQGADRMCALHCINGLLQGPYFSEETLQYIANELDQEELQLMAESGVTSPDYQQYISQGSANVSDDGYFNITVLEQCLKNMQVACIPYNSPESVATRENPSIEEGYICNLSEHWFAIRKLYGIWYNLDSLKPSPTVVSEFYLSAFLSGLISKGYSIFIAKSKPETSLPMPVVQNNVNRNQRYLSPADIDELQRLHKIKEESDKKAMETLVDSGEVIGAVENSGSFVERGKISKAVTHQWPEGGGRRLAENGSSDKPTQVDTLAAVDPELAEAMRLSVETFYKELPELPNEPPAGDNTVFLQVRLPSGSRLSRRFLKTEKLSNVFLWIEIVMSTKEDTNAPLRVRYSYSLMMQFPRRKFCKLNSGYIEFAEDESGSSKDVSGSLLEEFNFHSQEMLALQEHDGLHRNN